VAEVKDDAAAAAERCVLGLMCSSADCLHESMSRLTAEDFGDERHQRIFAAAANLYGNMAVDLVTMHIELDTTEMLYLAKCAHDAPTYAAIDSYIRLVLRGKQRRRVREVAQEMLAATETSAGDPGVVVGEAVLKLAAITDSQEFVTIGDLVEDVAQERAPEGLPWCLPQLNALTGGLQKGTLVFVAGPTSKGKTVLTAQTVARIAEMGRWVLFFPLEMSPRQLTRRLLAAEARIDGQLLRSPQISIDEQQRISAAVAKLMQNDRIIFHKGFGVTSLQVEAAARRLKAEGRCDLVVVDYLQLLADRRVKGENTNDRVSGISQRMKALARSLDIPVLCVSQVSRRGARDEGGLELSDLRDSGALEQDADIVVFIQPDRNASKNADDVNVEIKVEKHRDGRTGTFPAKFRRALGRFEAI
jgi:replicative DNA helicase